MRIQFIVSSVIFLSSTAASHAVETIQIHALPLTDSILDAQQPSIVLKGDKLLQQSATSLGETLSQLPGVHNNAFGGAAGRPVIRGLSGSRIEILQNGMGSHDLSALSPDHAVTTNDTLLSNQVEIIQGPATLLYGPNAIGGVVNVVDGRMPKKIANGTTGSMFYQYDSATIENAFAAKLQTTWNDNYTFYIDTFKRRSHDYKIPGYSDADYLLEKFHDDEKPEKGRLENSDWDFQSGAIGFSYEDEKRYWGVSLSYHLGNYGLPGHSHVHEDEHDHEEEGDHEDEDHDEHEEHEAHDPHDPARLDLQQIRVDSELVINEPFHRVDQIRWLINYTDYSHQELEGDLVATDFDNDVIATRVEIQPIIFENWNTLLGLQLKHRKFSAIGEEAFVPKARTINTGLFVLGETTINRWDIALGARYDFAGIKSDDFKIDEDCRNRRDNNKTYHGMSGSAGLTYHINDHYQIALIYNHSKRIPAIEELFACGEHLATKSFERGNTDLSLETANTVDLTFKKTLGLVTGSLNLFYYDFDDYIFAEFIKDDDDLNQLQIVQQDARLWGSEMTVNFPITRQPWGVLSGNLMADYVRGKTKSENLPRISPWRFGFSVDYRYQNWFADVGVTFVDEQTKTARYETKTDGYTLLEAQLRYKNKIGSTDYEIFLRGNNLLNEEVRLHTSYIKDRAPAPGRGVTVGFKIDF